MKHPIIFFTVLCMFYSAKSFTQNDISMATNWYNRANYNPASIAKPDYIYLFSNARKQWLGIEGAPSVFNIQASEYIHSLNSAFGISMVSDQIGVSGALNPMLTYAYRIANQDWSLSMGLSAGVFTRFINGSLYEPEDTNDPTILKGIENLVKPDANIGIEFQSAHFIFGLSSTHLFSIFKDSSLFLNSNHRYGYIIFKNSESELYNYRLGLQVVNRYNLTVIEGNTSIRFKTPNGLLVGPVELFDVGVTYNTTNQLAFLFGINITNYFRVGYAYQQTFKLGYNQNGTHEIMLEYRIPSKASSTCIQCGLQNHNYWYY